MNAFDETEVISLFDKMSSLSDINTLKMNESRLVILLSNKITLFYYQININIQVKLNY